MTSLGDKIRQFKADVQKHLAGKDGVVMATAYLVSDNVIVDLFKNHTNMMPAIAGVDTLHLFPQTLQVRDAVQNKYGVKIHEYKPEGCNTLADFNKKFGTWQELSHADFDAHSKINPLKKGFQELGKKVTITGRRRDQGNERVELDVFEAEKNTFNPLAGWSWDDVCDYVLKFNVPYNTLHKRVFISEKVVDAINRNEKTAWRAHDLELPFFAYRTSHIQSLGPNVYVWKSFGDVHTSCQVAPYESERAGRFVGRANTECGIHTRISDPKAPHGGKLINLIKPEYASMKFDHTIELNERQVCDTEQIMNGGFSPLEGFMTEAQYNSVVEGYRLPEGQLFGLPVTMDTDSEAIQVGHNVLLTSKEFCPNADGKIAILQVTSKYIPDRRNEGLKVYGTESEEHPAVWHLVSEKKKYNIGGKIFGITLPHRDWVTCKTPKQVREEFKKHKAVVAFQCRNPIHRAHAAMFLEVSKEFNAEVLVHPIVGPTKSDDFSAKVRKLTYDKLDEMLDHIHFEYLAYNMMVGGPREALQHMLVRKNYGCTHMIVGRDHAGCKNKKKQDFYGPYDAQQFIESIQDELGIKMIPFKAMVYIKEKDHYFSMEVAKQNGWQSTSLSGTEFRRRINAGEEVPNWFAYEPVVKILRQHYGPDAQPQKKVKTN